jgi:PAS domain S-box-containing protein
MKVIGRRPGITAEAATGSPPPRHLDGHDDHLEDLKALLEERTNALVETFEALKACGEKYSAILDTMPLAFLSLDENLRVLSCNSSAERLMGPTGEDLVGKRLWSSPHRDAGFKRRYSQALSEQRPVAFQDFSAVARRWLDVRAYPSDRRGLIVYLRDITKEKKNEEIMARLWQDYRSLADNSPDLILRFDEALHCTFANKQFRRFIGTDQAHVIGKTPAQLGLPRETADQLNTAMREALGTKDVVSTDLEIATAEGRKYFSWRTAPEIDVNGRVSSVLVIATDVTRQREEEETRLKLEEQLRESQRLEAVGTLSGGIAHDFNNLLAIIIGNTELALDAVPEDSPGSHELKRVFTAALRGRDLVKQILAFSRKSAQHAQPFSLMPLIKETAKLLRSTISTTIEIRLDLEAEHDTVIADPTQMQQVLLNLTTNAAQAMAEGGVMTVALREITLDTQNLLPDPDLNTGDYLVLSVADTGEGMDDSVRQRIFEPFFTTKRQGKGSGLGLSVVYGIVKSQGGAITVSSTKGKGSTFRVFVPKAQERAPGDAVAKPAFLPTGRGSILVVDDEELIASMVEQSLSRLGYEMYAETDPEAALNLFRRDPARFDLVITDQAMPRMTGLTLAKRLLQVRRDIPILLCTGYSATVDEKSAKDAGIKGFLMKPLTRDQLAVVVKQTLEAGGKEDGPSSIGKDRSSEKRRVR